MSNQTSKEIRSFKQGTELQLRSVDGKNRISGYCIRFAPAKSEDLGGFVETIAPTALDRTLRENPDIFLLREHRSELLLGRTGVNLVLSKDSNGIKFDCTLLDTTTGNDAYRDIKAGLLTSCSFGFTVGPNGDSWKQDANGTLIRTLLDIDLIEATVCNFPAYSATSVDARAIRSQLQRDLSDTEDTSADDQNDEYCSNCPCDRCLTQRQKFTTDYPELGNPRSKPASDEDEYYCRNCPCSRCMAQRTGFVNPEIENTPSGRTSKLLALLAKRANF